MDTYTRYAHNLQSKTDNKGFSLVELIVVIAIMVVLISLLVPNVIGYIRKTEKVADMAAAKTIGNAAEMVIATDPKAMRSYIDCTTKSSGRNTSTGVGLARVTAGNRKLVIVAYTAIIRYDKTKSWAQLDGALKENSYPNKPAGRNDCSLNMWHAYNESKYFATKLRETLGGKLDMKISCKNPSGNLLDPKMNAFIICSDEKTANIEVWLGYKGSSGYVPCYELYPERDPDF